MNKYNNIVHGINNKKIIILAKNYNISLINLLNYGMIYNNILLIMI